MERDERGREEETKKERKKSEVKRDAPNAQSQSDEKSERCDHRF